MNLPFSGNGPWSGPLAMALTVAAALSVGACGGGGDAPQGAKPDDATQGAKLDTTQCQYTFDPSIVVGRDVQCGVLVAPQDRRNPAGGVVRIPYAVFKSPGASTQSPVVYLTGGPGGSWVDTVASVKKGKSPGLDSVDKLPRDEVVIEQRGSSGTAPSLDSCAMPTWAPEAHIDWQAAQAIAMEAVQACAAGTTGRGIQAAGFNTDELAADVADLARLLGYQKVVLNGVSYGTMWASAILRDFPTLVESAILDSVVQQPQLPLARLAEGFEPALQALSNACAASPACAATGANFVNRVETLVTALDQQPLVWSRGPSGQLTSGVLMSSLIPLMAFYSTALPEYIDFFEALVQQRRWVDGVPAQAQDLVFQLGTLDAQASYQGQYLSIVCADNASVTLPQVQAQLSTIRPAFRTYVKAATESLFQACQRWPARRDLPASSLAPVRSNVPILILSGAADPLTPRAWALEAASTLPAAILVEFPLRGHSLQSGSCVASIVKTFLEGTLPNTACAATDLGL